MGADQGDVKVDGLNLDKDTERVRQEDTDVEERSVEEITNLERKLVRKVDFRLCTIAGILCSLNLLDSGIISSASVTSIFEDLGLGVGNRYVGFEFFYCNVEDDEGGECSGGPISANQY
jgi:hypothetical protein